MGYSMPIVCKELYLPITPDVDDGITLKKYKEKYGIDLKELLGITILPSGQDYTMAISLPKLTKVYVVSLKNPLSEAMQYVIPVMGGVNKLNQQYESQDGTYVLGTYSQPDGSFAGLEFHLSGQEVIPTIDGITLSASVI